MPSSNPLQGISASRAPEAVLDAKAVGGDGCMVGGERVCAMLRPHGWSSLGHAVIFYYSVMPTKNAAGL